MTSVIGMTLIDVIVRVKRSSRTRQAWTRAPQSGRGRPAARSQPAVSFTPLPRRLPHREGVSSGSAAKVRQSQRK